jgi:hypothetical protein
MTVAFKELQGSPIEDYGPNGITARREVVCSWADRHALRDELLGDGYAFNTTPAATYPGNDQLVAMNVQIKPFDNAVPGVAGALSTNEFTDIKTEIADYDIGDASSKKTRAHISIGYELIPLATLSWPTGSVPGNQIENETFLTYRRTSGTEYAILKGGGGLRWEDDIQGLEPPKEAFPTQRIPVTDHILTWHRVLDPPWSAINRVKGTVNRDEWFGFPAQTILFDGEDSERQFYMFGGNDPLMASWRITYTFRERRIQFEDENGNAQVGGWCHTWREEPAENARWSRLVRAKKVFGAEASQEGVPAGTFVTVKNVANLPIYIYNESGANIINAAITDKDFFNLFKYQSHLPFSNP